MRKEKFGANKLLSLVFCLAGLISVTGIFHISFSLPEFPIVLFSATLSCCAFFVLFTVFAGRKRRFILFCFLCFWIVFGFIFWEQIVYGAIVFSRILSPYFIEAMHYESPVIQPFMGNAETACLWFEIYTLVPYALWMAWIVVVRRNTPVALLITIPPVAFAYMLTNTLPGIFMAILLAFWAALLLQARLPKPEKKGIAKSRAMCLALCMAVSLAIFAIFPQESYTPSSMTIAFREQIKDAAADVSYTLAGASGGPIGNREGSTNLDATGSVLLSDNTVLNIYASEPQDIYLRGYAASEYTGHEWIQTGGTSFERSEIEVQPMAYLTGNGTDYFEGNRSQIRIEPARADSPWLFTPYRFAQIQNTAIQPGWIGDNYLPSEGEDTYTYEIYGAAEQTVVISGSGHSVPQWLVSNMDKNGNRKTGSISFEGYNIGFTSTAAGVLLNEGGDAITKDAMERAYEYFHNPPEDVDTLSLFYPQENTDANYLRYITEEYTQLPDGLCEQLLAWWAEKTGTIANGNAPYYSWNGLAGSVAEAVRGSGVYTTTPGQQPQNRDFVEYFLTESNKGYCVHFASATTAILRALGIPARYVEGYVVQKSDFDSNGRAQVSAKTAHAWAEIWIPDLGWTPVESTPGGDAVPQELLSVNIEEGKGGENDAGMQEGIEVRRTEETSAPAETPFPVQTSEPEKGGASSTIETDTPASSGKENTVWLSCVIAVVGGALLLLPVCRRIKWMRSFRQPDSNRAVLCMYAYLCEFSAYGRDVVSREATGVAREARFGARSVSAEKVRFMENEAQAKRRQALSTLKWWKRLWLFWKGL